MEGKATPKPVLIAKGFPNLPPGRRKFIQKQQSTHTLKAKAYEIDKRMVPLGQEHFNYGLKRKQTLTKEVPIKG